MKLPTKAKMKLSRRSTVETFRNNPFASPDVSTTSSDSIADTFFAVEVSADGSS
jgi:hypothetical protein